MSPKLWDFLVEHLEHLFDTEQLTWFYKEINKITANTAEDENQIALRKIEEFADYLYQFSLFGIVTEQMKRSLVEIARKWLQQEDK